MEFVALAALVALVKKVIDLYNYVAEDNDYRKAGKTLLVFVAGVGVAFLGAEADLTSTLDIAGTTLGSVNDASLVLVGSSLGALASTAAVDIPKALGQPTGVGDRI